MGRDGLFEYLPEVDKPERPLSGQGEAWVLRPERRQIAMRAVDLDGFLPVDHRARLVWQHPPRQAATQQIEQRLNDLLIAPKRWSAQLRARRKQWLQYRPFAVCQIAWQKQAASGKLLAGGSCPHMILHRCITTPIESQMTDITQLLFRSDTKLHPLEVRVS